MVPKASAGTREVTENIIEVPPAAGKTGEAAGEVTDGAHDLNTKAEERRNEVESFLKDDRAASSAYGFQSKSKTLINVTMPPFQETDHGAVFFYA